MLQLREDQMERFRAAQAEQFERRMVAHAGDFAPDLYRVIGPEQMRLAIRPALDRGRAYGFTFCGPLRLFVEMTLLCGSGFDTDPQYPALRDALKAPADQMLRAQQLFELIVQQQSKVAGPDAENVFRALQTLWIIAREPNRYHLQHLDEQLLWDMTAIFPEKAAYVREPALRDLIASGRTEAVRYGFDTARAQALIPILMFSFGHWCANDPLYPWIARTLTDPKIVSPAARAKRLENKAVTWLDHVLAARGTS